MSKKDIITITLSIIAIALSLSAFLYNVVKDLIVLYRSRFMMKANIVEWFKTERSGKVRAGMPMRLQLINLSNSSLIISHIEITDNENNIMQASDFSHLLAFRKIEKEDFKEPIHSTQLPLVIAPRSGENVALHFEGKMHTTIQKDDTKIILDTNRGTKTIKPVKVSEEMNPRVFS